MSMSEKDYLKMVNDLENRIPKPSDANLEWNRFIAEWKDAMVFLRKGLGNIDSIVVDQFTKKIGKFFSGTRSEKKLWAREDMTHNLKDGFVLLRDWIGRKFRYVSPVQASSSQTPKGWFYCANGIKAFLRVWDVDVDLTPTTEKTGRGYPLILLQLLSWPKTEGITEEQFIGAAKSFGDLKQKSYEVARGALDDALLRFNSDVAKQMSGRYLDIQGKDFIIKKENKYTVNPFWM